MYYHTFSPVEYSVRRTKSNDINEPLVEGTATKKSLKDSYVDAKESPLLCFSKQQFIRRFVYSLERKYCWEIIVLQGYFARSLYKVICILPIAYSVYLLCIGYTVYIFCTQLLVPKGIIHPLISVSALTWFIGYIYH